MSDPLDSEKQFFDGLEDNLSQFYEDSGDDKDVDLYSLHDYLRESHSRFSNEDFFASGATKKVYSVLETSTERKIALARPHKNDKKIAESFLKEARRTSLLEHPNIVRVYDIGVDEQGPWFSMELIEGSSLQQKISQVKIAEKEWDLYERLEIFNKVCDAMSYAHSIGILHLDIKPDNIRLGEFGEILLCDWGLSFLDYKDDCSADLSNDQTIHGTVKGTPGYMAPEQIKGDKSVQSDVFSLGALLFALLTYRPPFEDTKTEEVLLKTMKGEIDFSEFPKIPERLVPVIHKALNPDLTERYKSVKELQEEINKYRAGFATSAEEPSLLTQLILLYSRNRRISLITLAFLFLIISLTFRHIFLIEEKQSELQAEKKKTEEAFELYKSEEKARDEILGQFSHSLVIQSRIDLDSFDVESSLKNLRKALTKDPTNKDTLMQLGFVHFIRQNFTLASNFFNRANSSKVEDMSELSQTYIENKGLMPAKQLIDMFDKLNRNNLMLYMYTYYAKKQKDHDQVVELTKYIIEKSNRIKNMNFVYDEAKKILSLADNSKLKRLFSSKSRSIKSFYLIRYLDVDHLDLSNSGFVDLNDLSSTNLLSLNLQETSIKSIEQLKSIPSLRKLVLSENQKHLVQSDYHFEIVFK
ncbi:MAG: protein kinase [Lentisphaeraceae bacterium]|nr:protein kinase [Lentisphaeraceae bacterium]